MFKDSIKWRKPISTLCDHIEIIYFTTTFPTSTLPHYNSITFRDPFNNTYLSNVKLGMTQLPCKTLMLEYSLPTELGKSKTV